MTVVRTPTDLRQETVTRRSAIITSLSLLGAAALGGVEGCTSARPRGRRLTAAAHDVELGRGVRTAAWLYDGSLPGPELRYREGERIRIELNSKIPADTSIHWHGMLQRGTNSMDGVPGVTQPPVKPGSTFSYDFAAEPAGTFFFHSHFGLQIEHGLHGPLIVEPVKETMSYDREYVIVLDDWPAAPPEEMLANLRAGRPPIPGMNAPMAGMASAAPTPGGGGLENVASVVAEEGPDVAYKYFLMNGRTESDPPTFDVRPAQRVRFRLINAAAATGFRFSIGGHRMQVTHADGNPVKPVEVDTLEIAMGERYDFLLTGSNSGLWSINAMSVDEPARGAIGTLRYSNVPAGRTANARAASAPNPSERLLRYADLLGVETPTWKERADRVIEVSLIGQMVPYAWSIGGGEREGLHVSRGEVVTVRMRNRTPMRHPMHLHGHSFGIRSGSGTTTVVKDTASVEPGATLEIQFIADNPGDWLFHCHHAYHQETGMARVIKYLPK